MLAAETYFSWAEGFMSGLNLAKPQGHKNKLDSSLVEQNLAHIKDYCDANPQHDYFQAVIDLYRSLPIE
jgi:uncharacterized protein YgfB (UPF0149 family)